MIKSNYCSFFSIINMIIFIILSDWPIYLCWNIWRSPSLNELTPMIVNTALTHLGSETSILHNDI